MIVMLKFIRVLSEESEQRVRNENEDYCIETGSVQMRLAGVSWSRICGITGSKPWGRT